MKISMYSIYNKLVGVEKMLQEKTNKERVEFRAIDYRDYIRVDLDEFEMAWKYKGIYFKNKSELFRKLVVEGSYNKQRQTLYELLTNPNRQREMWDYEIQLVYIKRLKINNYLTCEGNILTVGSLTLVRGNPSNDKINLQHNNETFVASRSYAAYKNFIDPSFTPKQKLMYYDGFYGNCSIDNLTAVDETKITKGLW